MLTEITNNYLLVTEIVTATRIPIQLMMTRIEEDVKHVYLLDEKNPTNIRRCLKDEGVEKTVALLEKATFSPRKEKAFDQAALYELYNKLSKNKGVELTAMLQLCENAGEKIAACQSEILQKELALVSTKKELAEANSRLSEINDAKDDKKKIADRLPSRFALVNYLFMLATVVNILRAIPDSLLGPILVAVFCAFSYIMINIADNIDKSRQNPEKSFILLLVLGLIVQLIAEFFIHSIAMYQYADTTFVYNANTLFSINHRILAFGLSGIFVAFNLVCYITPFFKKPVHTTTPA